MKYDIVIVGAGVVGAAIAQRLARYDLSIAWVEKETDVACGASKANSGIVHAGFDAAPGSLMAALNVAGNALYEDLCADLEVPFLRNGSLVVGFSEEDKAHLERLQAKGQQNAVPGLEILNGDACRVLEPNLAEDVKWGLLAPSGGITCPYELTIALAENAVENGVTLQLGHGVRSVSKLSRGAWSLTVGGHKVEADVVINAAGAGAPALSELAGAGTFPQILRRGEYSLLDKRQQGLITRTIFQTPGPLGKGVLVTPTVDGNLLVGPTAQDTEDATDTETTRSAQRELLQVGARSVPNLPARDIINSFCGVRAIVGTDFHIAQDERGWINVLGICSPGLTSAPAIGLYIEKLLAECGYVLQEKQGVIKTRQAIPRFREMTNEERGTLVKSDTLFGRVICRCETVTEGEIVAAIHRPIPAVTVDAVKRRVRAGMGRCQGGFCLPRVLEIIARETRCEMSDITKTGHASYVLSGRIRKGGA